MDNDAKQFGLDDQDAINMTRFNQSLDLSKIQVVSGGFGDKLLMDETVQDWKIEGFNDQSGLMFMGNAGVVEDELENDMKFADGMLEELG